MKRDRTILYIFIGILVVFGVVITCMVLWTPIKVQYYAWKLDYGKPVTNDGAVKALLEIGSGGFPPVMRYCEKRYPAAGAKERIAITDVLCAAGEKGKSLLKEMFLKRCRMEMVNIPAGSFMMGDKDIAAPVHEVTLSAFRMDKYEVTNEKYYTFVKHAEHNPQPSHWSAGTIPEGLEDHPVVYVSWKDAKAYADWLGMRLPTEAEWEYACRAGSTGKWCCGDNESELGEYAWYRANSGNKTHPVGKKKPNKWGLYDIHGNVWEWCADWYGAYSKSPSKDPKGPASGSYRVLRGGSWGYDAYYCLSALRNGINPDYWVYSSGFRVSGSSSAR